MKATRLYMTEKFGEYWESMTFTSREMEEVVQELVDLMEDFEDFRNMF